MLNTTEDYPQEIGFFSKLDKLPISFGAYTLESLVSNGNAIVFKARQKDPERVVALKIPKFGILNSKQSRDQFRTEYALAAALRHPAIVPVLEVGQWEGIPYYTMPFIQGHSLLDYVLIQKPCIGKKIELFGRICEIVSTLHEEGLIHCDLKSENIMIDEFGEVALLDFGLAHIASGKPQSLDNRMVAGTIRYMSPEQASGVPAEQLGFQTDVFALGVIGFRLFTGAFPFVLPENKVLALQAVEACEINFVPLTDVPIPLSIKLAVKHALSKEVENRPSDAGSLCQLMQFSFLKIVVRSILNRRDTQMLLLIASVGLALSLWGGLALVMG